MFQVSPMSHSPGFAPCHMPWQTKDARHTPRGGLGGPEALRRDGGGAQHDGSSVEEGQGLLLLSGVRSASGVRMHVEGRGRERGEGTKRRGRPLGSRSERGSGLQRAILLQFSRLRAELTLEVCVRDTMPAQRPHLS